MRGKEAKLQALVFSAGGAFGAYEAGAWQALEEGGFRPRIVVGTSVGSVTAAAVARGCQAVRLQQWWRDPASDVFRWNWPPRGLGLLDQSLLESRIERLLQEFPRVLPGRRLLVTVTELPGTAIRVFADERVTARCLLASRAIRVIFPPVRVEGKCYADGGVFCRLPIGVAVEAGATEIVAVDLPAAPPKPLGSIWDMVGWDARNVERWIEAGYRDAAAVWGRRSESGR